MSESISHCVRAALPAAAMICCLGLIGGATADCLADDQDAKPVTEEKQETTKPDGEKKGEDKPQPTLLERLSKDLLKDLDGSSSKPAEKEKENKLDKAAKGMRSAGDKLTDNKTGDDTRKVQQQVIKDLDDLIKQMENPPQGQGGGGGGGGGGASGSMTTKAGAAGKSGQMPLKKSGAGSANTQQAKAQEQNLQGQKAGQNEKKGTDSSAERTEAEKKAAEDAARKKKLEMDVWGHLPPHLREQLLNTYGERMLPKYQQLVKQFYEALSDQNAAEIKR